MKFSLFICISLLASLLHAAAMPIHGSGGLPMNQGVGETNESLHDHHASRKPDGDHDGNHCHLNQSACCLIVALEPGEAMHATSIFREEYFASRFFSQPIFRLESLYRPPKFYPASAG